MKTFLKGAALALVLSVPLTVGAAEFLIGDDVAVRPEQSAGNVYAAAGTVTITSALKADLAAAGGTVLVNAPVAFDIAAAGGTLTFTSTVGGDLRAAGGSITVLGATGNDLILAGGTINVTGSVGGDAALMGGTIRLEGSVAGKVHATGGDVYINSAVAGDVVVEAGTLTLGPKAVITGSLTHKGPHEPVLEAGAQVLGATTYESSHKDEGALAALIAFVSITKLLMVLAGAFALGLLMRRRLEALAHAAHARPLLELGRGFATLILAPVVAVLLCVTVVGLPLGLMALLGYFVALIFSWLAAPVILGSILYASLTRTTILVINWKTILLGVAASYIIGFIPILGPLVNLVFMLLTLGAAVGLAWSRYKEVR